MSPLPLRFDDLTLQHLKELVATSAREDQYLDFKSTFPDLDGKSAEKVKKDLLVDVAAFANAGGGNIIFGMEEGRDDEGRANGVAASLRPFVVPNLDALERRWMDIIEAGLDPRLSPKVRFRALADGIGHVVCLRIPRSIAAPHMVRERGLFYARRGAQNMPLDTAELRAAFVAGQAGAERIRRFRNDRIAKIIADETPVLVDAADRLVVHLVPLAVRAGEVGLDVTQLKGVQPPKVHRSFGPRFNIDGVAIVADEHEGRSGGYVQFFRDGSLEIVEYAGAAMRQGEFYIQRFERDVLDYLERYVPILERGGSSRPFALLLSLVGLRGMRPASTSPWPGLREGVPAQRDLYTLPDVIIGDEVTRYDVHLRPLFDTMWQTFGFERSPSYDANGSWTGPGDGRDR
jgi:hypothetical protein